MTWSIPKQRLGRTSMPGGVLAALASLRLTVALFALAMCLIFAGTLAQVNQGIWPTIDGYFRSPVAWIELQLFVPQQLATVPGSLPSWARANCAPHRSATAQAAARMKRMGPFQHFGLGSAQPVRPADDW